MSQIGGFIGPRDFHTFSPQLLKLVRFLQEKMTISMSLCDSNIKFQVSLRALGLENADRFVWFLKSLALKGLGATISGGCRSVIPILDSGYYP
jgi:hypothetical protein